MERVSKITAALTLLALLFFAERAFAVDCGPAPEVSAPSAEARRANDEAIALSKAGRHAEALEAFQRAYDLSPSWVILYNIGNMAVASGDLARAIPAFECHLVHGGAAIDATRRAAVDAELRRIRGEVGLLVIETPEDGTQIEVDGLDIGSSPLASPVVVNPGSRLVRIKRQAGSESRVVEVGRGARVVVRFGAAPIDQPTRRPDEPFRFPPGLVGAAWIVTGITGVGLLVTGTLALVGQRDIEDDFYLGPAQQPDPRSNLASKVETTRAMAIAADVFLGAFVLSGVAAISFSLINASAPDDGTASTALPMKVSIGPGHVGFEVALP